MLGNEIRMWTLRNRNDVLEVVVCSPEYVILSIVDLLDPIPDLRGTMLMLYHYHLLNVGKGHKDDADVVVEVNMPIRTTLILDVVDQME